MKRCVIFCGGEYGATDFVVEPEDFVICCDKGCDFAARDGIKPHLALGDFDSIEGQIPEGIEILRFPAQKDDTDSMLAVKEALRRGFDTLVLLYSLGGRLDHTFANIAALAFAQQQGAAATLIGPNETVCLLGQESRSFKQKSGHSLSVFAWGGSACVSLLGVAYPLESYQMSDSFPIGLGNKITAESATVLVTEGRVAVIQSKI